VNPKDFPHLRDIFSGAAPLGPELTDELKQKFPNVCVRQGYGMTELSPVATVDKQHSKPGSVGYLVPNMEAKVVDPETGVEAQPGAADATGELWLRGPNVMKGYLGNEKATRETIDSDGFLHTGDICRIDSDGCIFIVDRLKELIKAKGFQVAPAELEALLAGHPEVADAAVIGAPAQKYGGRESDGEVPKAFVIPQPGSKLTPASLAAWMAPQVAEYKKLTEATIQFVEAIPKLPSGKILRKDLRVLEKGLPGTTASKL
jgi:acyl-CoA synthetase (AMP-forming)/AMP-acid ligase II